MFQSRFKTTLFFFSSYGNDFNPMCDTQAALARAGNCLPWCVRTHVYHTWYSACEYFARRCLPSILMRFHPRNRCEVWVSVLLSSLLHSFGSFLSFSFFLLISTGIYYLSLWNSSSSPLPSLSLWRSDRQSCRKMYGSGFCFHLTCFSLCRSLPVDGFLAGVMWWIIDLFPSLQSVTAFHTADSVLTSHSARTDTATHWWEEVKCAALVDVLLSWINLIEWRRDVSGCAMLGDSAF